MSTSSSTLPPLRHRAELDTLRQFVAADPVEFTETGNQVREQRIEAALARVQARDPGMTLGEFYAELAALNEPPLTVEGVIESQRIVAEILAQTDCLMSERAVS